MTSKHRVAVAILISGALAAMFTKDGVVAIVAIVAAYWLARDPDPVACDDDEDGGCDHPCPQCNPDHKEP